MSELIWGNEKFALRVLLDASLPVGTALACPADWSRSSGESGEYHPLVEALTVETGRSRTNTRLDRTAIGAALRYVRHSVSEEGGWRSLRIEQFAPEFGLEAVTLLRQRDGVGAIRFATTLRNRGERTLSLTALSSVVLADGSNALGDPDALDLVSARSTWSCESRWGTRPLRGSQGIPAYSDWKHDGQTSREVIRGVGRSSWSTDGDLPFALVTNRENGRSLGWEVENNGPWTWEVIAQRDVGLTFSVALLGPTDLDHSWCKVLAPGAEFTTVAASVFCSDGGVDGIAGEATRHRRASQHPQVDPNRAGVIFNDYMNTLMGDPTTEKLLPLIDAAADLGAETFCIDAGWYDDGRDWWPSVGAWEPSTTRFPDGGLSAVLDRIRKRGMRPGLWVEPEVVGVNSPMAESLPADAFMTRNGARITEHDRYFLDLRSPAARAHLDSVFDRLTGELGAGYFKWDFNVTPGTGPDRDADSPGAGLLDHCDALDRWASSLRDRLDDVCIEACSSGAMRMDSRWLRLFDLQSTSDQQDLVRYATIAAAAPMMIPPERAGNWAYPEPWMSLEQIAFTMINGLAGRLYLSGQVVEMSAEQLGLISEGVQYFTSHAGVAGSALPFWPLGLPSWDDALVALGLRGEKESFLFFWKRGPVEPREVQLGVPFRSAQVVYPRALGDWNLSSDAGNGVIGLAPGSDDGISARVIRIEHQGSSV